MAQRSKKTKTSRKYAKGTVSQKWGFFRRMLEAAVQCGLIPGNPVAELSPNGGRRARRAASPLAESKTMDQQERAHLLCIAVEKLGGVALWAVVLFALMALAGLRFGEARALQRPDLELDHRHPKDGRAPRIHVRRTERLGILGPPKHGRARYVSVVPILEQLLREYVKTLPPGSIWLFPGQLPRKGGKVRANYERGGHPLEMGWCVSETGARSQWHVVLAAAQLGRKLSPKALRHAFCTIALSQGSRWSGSHVKWGTATSWSPSRSMGGGPSRGGSGRWPPGLPRSACRNDLSTVNQTPMQSSPSMACRGCPSDQGHRITGPPSRHDTARPPACGAGGARVVRWV